jgi:hypothetical protein
MGDVEQRAAMTEEAGGDGDQSRCKLGMRFVRKARLMFTTMEGLELILITRR